MDTFRGYEALTRRLNNPVVAIGNFDGVHRGHVHLFAQTRKLAAGLDGEAVVLTFDPHPAKVLAPRLQPPLISTLRRKLELIAQEGIAATVLQPFDLAFAQRAPDEFIRDVLVGGLGCKHVVVGYDFTFGAKRAGTVQLLAEVGPRQGFGVTVIPPVTVDGIVCSSTKVREFVLEGRVDGAQLVLGRSFEVEGEVVRGDGRGRKIGVPTANLRCATELVPKNGVYAGWAVRTRDGQRWGAAINVGTNPTFVNGANVSVEAHLLDCDQDLYSEVLRVGFVERLRAEERFASIEALVAQIHADVAQTRALLAGRPEQTI
jgi:riboflavin kinase/FMN adenylyltransferase